MAEHEHGEWSDQDRIRLIGLIRTDRLPSLRNLTTAIPDGAVAYAVGHAAFDFIDDRWGKEGVRQLLIAAGRRGADFGTLYASTFKLTPDAFDREFAEYLREMLAPLPASGSPAAAASIAEIVRPATGGGPDLLHFSATRIDIANTTLRNLIRYAYGLQQGAVVGGPAWLDTDRFDVVSAGDGDGSHLGSPALRDLLGRRFHLALRRDTRKAPGYALTLVTPGQLGPRIKPSTSDCAADSHDETPRVRTVSAVPLPGLQCGEHWLRGRAGAEARANGVTTGMLARSLTLEMHLEQPIVDNTGLGGTFDFEMEFEPSLTEALREQLGMRLVPIDVNVDVFVVDGIQRPGAN